MPSAQHAAAKRRAALASVFASAGLTLAKLVVGLLTGSIAILSEALHSLLDLGATVITLLAIRAGDKPPDANHPYGHGKIESMAALSETALLLVTACGILWEAARRLTTGESTVEFTWWSAATMVCSIAVDLARSRALRRLARITGSPALEADALHFTSDIFSSTVVLAGLGLVAIGYRSADSAAAIGVAGFVALAAIRLGRRTIDTLIDTAPEGIAERVRAIAKRTPGVVEVGRVRARVAGAWLQIDLEAGVSRRLSLDRSGDISREVRERVLAAFPDSEVTIQTHPKTLDDESVRERILMIAAYDGHPVHHITVQHFGDQLAISLDLEVDGRQSLGEAHETATRLETAIAAELGGDVEVETHIEPLMHEPVNSVAATPELTREIERSIACIAREMPEVLDTHDVRVRQDSGGLFISFHCTFASNQPIDLVHETASQIEERLRQQFKAYRIVTHAEPPEKTGSSPGLQGPRTATITPA